jgi:hypothetical protein
MLNRALILFGMLIPLCGPATSQTVPLIGDRQPDAALTIKVGDGAISGKRMTPNEMAWSATSYPENGAPVRAGIWTTQVRLAELDGRKVLVRMAGATVFGHSSFKILGYNAVTTVVDAETLAPLWSENRNFDGTSEKWIVNGVHVEQHETGAEPQAKEVVHSFDTPVPAYDFEGPLFPFYLKALSLKVGYSGVIPAIGDQDHPLRGVLFKVVRREKVQAGARGLVDAWVVECPDPNTGTLQFWFSDKFSFPIRMVIPAMQGSPKTVYEMIG